MQIALPFWAFNITKFQKLYIIRYNFFSGFLFFEFGSKVGRTITHIQHIYIHNIFTYSTNYFFRFYIFFDVSSYIIIGRM